MLIAQVSDIHASPDNEHLLRFDRVLTWLAHVRPDALVLSGDLTDDRWLEGYQQIAARLEQLDYPSLILPGNADDRQLMRATWGESRWAQDASTRALHAVHQAGALRLIGLDSTVEGEDYGDLSEHGAWLDSQLHHAGDSPVLLFTHHHLFPSGIPTLDPLMCRGLSELEHVIRNSPARLLAISAGHVHRPVVGTFAGVPAYICGSVCPANPVWFGTVNVPPVSDPPTLMLHRYIDNVLTSHNVGV
ncbi:metallophosphoesterase [Raoultella sp. RIT712]|uniref:metallophosphoesterase n=1 Tax=Raoultella sp. RIT712 TaxID=2666191 RepID=UPI0012AE95CF|nr:metallophosphoesterase [Raoultella sp. RIT712]MRT48157.1 metallophosphoesterase [Raoultella sp. RIT712]